MAGRLAVAVVLVALAAAAVAQDLAAFLDAQARLERRLLVDELRRHGEVRRREADALQRAVELQTRVDRALASEGGLVELEGWEQQLAEARAAASAAGDEARALRRTIYDRRRRLQLLGELARTAVVARPTSHPISGVWQVRILPQDQQGVFQLEADGTLVSGNYALGGGRTGSFRGTWTGGTLRLERIDAASGFDLVFEGRLDAGGDRIDGSWQSTLLNNVGPTGGTWVATRRPVAPAREGSSQ